MGDIVGCTLGNDVNLRDFEGRSALLLGKAKDNNGSAVVGPLIRLFDDSFTIDHVRNAVVKLAVLGLDGFILEGESSLKEIGRDITELVSQTLNNNHQYPDGLFLYTGTMFAPIKDRNPNNPGGGFTHVLGDRVIISSPLLGSLLNVVNHSDKIPKWEYGTVAFINSLKQQI